MRVVVRHRERKHPNHHWFAFEQGRILGFTNPLTGESSSSEEVADALLQRAQATFPVEDGYEHRVETLHAAGTDEDGEEVGEWHPAGKSKMPLAGTASVAATHVLLATQEQAEEVEGA